MAHSVNQVKQPYLVKILYIYRIYTCLDNFEKKKKSNNLYNFIRLHYLKVLYTDCFYLATFQSYLIFFSITIATNFFV